MSSKGPLQFSTRPATINDAQELCNVFSSALASDRYVRVKSINKQYDGHVLSTNFLRYLIYSPRHFILQANDNTTGDAIGWACWERRGYDMLDARESDEYNTGWTKDGEAGEDDGGTRGKPNRLLDDIEGKDEEYYTRTYRDVKCMILDLIAVSPAYQLRGVGSALTRWGTEKADADGVSCWAHALDAGYKLFVKHGFVEVGISLLDLDEFATGPCDDAGADGKWGVYTNRYMKRACKKVKADNKGPSSASGSGAISPAMKKLQVISTHFWTAIVPPCEIFIGFPPADVKRKVTEYTKLSEMVMNEILLELDAVDVEGDKDARQERRGIVMEAQEVLRELDDARSRE